MPSLHDRLIHRDETEEDPWTHEDDMALSGTLGELNGEVTFDLTGYIDDFKRGMIQATSIFQTYHDEAMKFIHSTPLVQPLPNSGEQRHVQGSNPIQDVEAMRDLIELESGFTIHPSEPIVMVKGDSGYWGLARDIEPPKKKAHVACKMCGEPTGAKNKMCKKCKKAQRKKK